LDEFVALPGFLLDEFVALPGFLLDEFVALSTRVEDIQYKKVITTPTSSPSLY
jgi:hypothetical protein